MIQMYQMVWNFNVNVANAYADAMPTPMPVVVQ